MAAARPIWGLPKRRHVSPGYNSNLRGDTCPKGCLPWRIGLSMAGRPWQTLLKGEQDSNLFKDNSCPLRPMASKSVRHRRRKEAEGRRPLLGIDREDLRLESENPLLNVYLLLLSF